MFKNGNEEPSKLTKVLVKKIHGGRKQDSRFWQSEFGGQGNEVDIVLEKPERGVVRRNRGLFSAGSFGLLIALLYLAVYLRPELFPFLDRHEIYKAIETPFKSEQMQHAPATSISSRQQPSINQEAKPKPTSPS